MDREPLAEELQEAHACRTDIFVQRAQVCLATSTFTEVKLGEVCKDGQAVLCLIKKSPFAGDHLSTEAPGSAGCLYKEQFQLGLGSGLHGQKQQ